MAATSLTRTIVRTSTRDGVFIALSAVHGLLLLLAPSLVTVAILMWWNANTISHNFIHRPFFRSKSTNRAYSLWLTLLLGVPQSLWRWRHLAHHAEAGAHPERADALTSPWASAQTWIETTLLAALWAVMLIATPGFLTLVYAPGLAIGLTLCWLHGYYEHAGGVTSHYGRVYNALFFNDGYHVEHHDRPHAHWTELPAGAQADARQSRWPAVLRWLDNLGLNALERLVLHSPRLQRFVVDRHERAFRALLPALPPTRRITIVGGGLFPRTAIVLRRLLPSADLTVVEARADHVGVARRFLDSGVRFREGVYHAGDQEAADLLIVPLAFIGDRRGFYEHPNAAAVIVHDWLWASHRPSARVSWLLLKRLNLIVR